MIEIGFFDRRIRVSDEQLERYSVGALRSEARNHLIELSIIKDSLNLLVRIHNGRTN